MHIEKETIQKYVEKWVNVKIDEKFEFRPHQKETIINVISNIVNHEHRNYIIEAPTGSGKSLINIISAGVLADFFQMDSYILVSDLFLWEQYENFLKKYTKTGIASLKGQTGNYICGCNGEDIRNADCRMAGISWSALFNKTFDDPDYSCACSCEYVQARKKAVKSKVCVITYQLFLFVMNNPNFNTDSSGAPIFKERDVLFCDECHNIPGIVQNQYAPTITLDHFDKLEKLYGFASRKSADLFDNNKDVFEVTSKYPTTVELRDELRKYWNEWLSPESRKDEDYISIRKYLDIVELFAPITAQIKNDIILKKQEKQNFTIEDVKMFKLASWYENCMCHFHDFWTAIMLTGAEYLLKDINVANDDQHISVAFKCTKEDYLVYMFLLQRAKYKVFCSATIGGKTAYDENMGFRYDADKEKSEELNESKIEVVPSSFDFSQSPIHFLNKFKMSFRDKEASFKQLKPVIYSICSTKFKDAKGMIQTGSYAFAKELFNDAPPGVKERMLVYNGSREKNIMVENHKYSKNTILVGPTLNTGVDLPGDDCRFIIILKVPYPSMIDPLVKEKIRLFPLWYNSSTSNEIIQGIGRGVRYNGDWCVTYILDACFWNLYISTKDQYPIELQNRIKII